jgi:hypothetical protein
MFCNDECHGKSNKFYEMREHLSSVFGVFNMVCLIGMALGIFLMNFARETGLYIFAGCGVVLAIIILLIPLPIDNMLDKWKIKKAVFATRIIGLCVMGLALIAFLLALFVF